MQMKFKGFTKKQLLEIYQQMALSRYLDDRFPIIVFW
jgi:TPP-dependent pyruvate/acetoin dehydrogenase alpha subunit